VGGAAFSYYQLDGADPASPVYASAFECILGLAGRLISKPIYVESDILMYLILPIF
jgi:hypothetical protein